MATIEIKKLGLESIDLLIKSRIDYCLRDNPEHTKEEFDLFYENVKKWTLENGKNYIGYFGYIKDELVSFAGVLIYDLPPTLKFFNRKQGMILSFFTYPKYRSKGIGDEMMKYIIKDTKKMGIAQLVLTATTMGEPLYRKNGFAEPIMKYMELNLE